MQMCCVRMPMSAKKKRRKKKRTYLEWGHADMNALRADGIACRWCYVRMALHVDALYGEVDGGSCRVGMDECKRKQKTKYLLKPGWTRACGCIACGHGLYWMWLVGDADECKEKRKTLT